MKKNKIIIIIAISLLLISFLSLKYTNYIKTVLEERKIEDIKTRLIPFSKGIKNNDNNELVKIFNSIIETKDKIDSLSYSDLTINDLMDLASTKDRLESRVNEIKKINFFEINNALNSYTEKEKKAIISIYNNSEIIYNKEEYINKVNDIINKINNDIELISFLQNNNEYTISNSIIYCKNDSFYNEILKFNKNLNIKKQQKISDSTYVYSPSINNSKKVPILTYHGFLDNPWGISNLFIRISEFEEQMKYLNENGYTTLFLSEIENANNYQKPIIITIDDGYLDVYTNAFPILKKYNIKANIFIISGWLGGDVYMTSDMLKEMALENNIEIGSHTISHPALASLSESNIESQLLNSKNAIESIIGKKINTLSYPTGSYNNTTIDIAKKYYDYAVTTNYGYAYANNENNYTLKRIAIYRGKTLNDFINLLL